MISSLLGIDRRSQQKYLEDPRNPLDPFGFGEKRNDAGIEVNRRSILGHPAVWRCVSLIAQSCARLPVDVYRYTDRPNKEVDRNHPAWWLLRRKPNELMTPYRFKRLFFVHALMGSAYAYIERDGNGRPTRLLLLDPERTFPYVDDRRPSELWYVTTIKDEPRKLDYSQVLHLQGLSLESHAGLPIVDVLKNAFALALAQRKYRTIYFKNNARPNVALEVDGRMSPEARIRLKDSYQSATAGLENSHRAILLEEGVKIHEYSANLRDNQLVEIEAHELAQIANIFGVPPHKVGAATNTSYKSLTEENQSFLDEGLDPHLVGFEEECWAKLLSRNEQNNDSHFVAFNRKAAVRSNMTARAEFYQSLLSMGVLNRDEVRAFEDMNAIPDGSGTEFLVPLNMGASSDLLTEDSPEDTVSGGNGEDDTQDDQQNEDTETDANPATQDNQRAIDILRMIYERDAARMVRRIATAATKEAKRGGNFLQWLDTIEQDHGRTVADAIGFTVRSIAELRGVGDPQNVSQQFIECIRQNLLAMSGEASSGADLAERIEQWANDFRVSTEVFSHA